MASTNPEAALIAAGLEHIDALPLLVSTGVLTIFGGIFVLMRLYLRTFVLKSVQWDDYLLIVAFLIGIGVYTILFRVAYYIRYLNLHDSSIDRQYWRFLHMEIGFCCAQNLFSRLSILIAYYRFTPREVSSKASRIFLNVTFVLTVIMSVLSNVMAMMPCWPPRVISFTKKFFTQRREGKIVCMTQEQIISLLGLVGIATDVLIFALPFALLRPVKLTRSVRKYLYAVFGFGFGVLLIGIIRLPFLLKLWPTTWDPLTEFDQTTLTVKLIMITWILYVAESNYFMVTASIPILAPSLRKWSTFFSLQRQKWSWSAVQSYRAGCQGSGAALNPSGTSYTIPTVLDSEAYKDISWSISLDDGKESDSFDFPMPHGGSFPTIGKAV